MVKKRPEDIQGLEYDWLACDSAGHIGFFSTAGGGYAPIAVLKDTDAFDRAIDLILSSGPTTTPQLSADLPARSTWVRMAERGIFAFDADPNGGPYKLVASPSVPTQLDLLPELARDVAAQIRLLAIRLGTAATVAAETLRDHDEANDIQGP